MRIAVIRISCACVLLAWLVAARPAAAQVTLATVDLAVRIDARGQIVSARHPSRGQEYLAAGQPAPLVQIRIGTRVEPPAAMTWDERAGVITLRFEPSGVRIQLKAVAKPTHLTLRIAAVEPAGLVDAVTWGPYPITIGDTVGEIIGVVRDTTFGLGLQVLNIKTLGGLPAHDEGSDPSRSRTAQSAPWGSVLQAYSLDRSRPRRVSGWTGQFPDMPVAPMPGETVVGSSIARESHGVETDLERLPADLCAHVHAGRGDSPEAGAGNGRR